MLARKSRDICSIYQFSSREYAAPVTWSADAQFTERRDHRPRTPCPIPQSAPSASTFPKRTSKTSADASRRHAGPQGTRRGSVARRAVGDPAGARRATGRATTTGARCEAKLNALPQFTTEIDGVDIHFIHVKSPHEDALPLIMTHGWPGSVIELLEIVGPLTDPTAHGGSAEDAFDLVLPSLPGYGFSGEPAEVGWDPGRTARAWAELMHRLGYTRYVAQGGDLGAIVADAMGRQAPEGLVGIHMNLLVTTLGAPTPPPGDTEEERAALDAINTFTTSGFGYFLEQSTRPQTIGYALLDSPVALAAWMLDHDTDSY